MIEYGRKCEDHNERGTTHSFSGNICKLTPRTILNALWQLVQSRHLRGLWNRGAVANFSFKRSVVPLSAGWQFLSFGICIWQHKFSLDMMINDYPFFSTNMSKKLIKSRPLDTQMMWNPYRMERFPPIPAPSPKNKMIPK